MSETKTSGLKEIKRLQTLLSYGIMDTPPEEDFDGLARLVSLICETPVGIISMIDDKRQWYKAKTGINATEVPLGETFCQYTILQDDLVEIPDARLDERVKDNPNVTGEAGIRFYAGVPLKAKNGCNIGSICAVDKKPKKLSKDQKEALILLTSQTMMLLEAKKKNKKLGIELQDILDKKVEDTQKQLLQKEIEYNYLLKAIRKSNGVVEFSPDGIIKSVNQNFLNIIGYNKEELIGHHHAILLDEEQRKNNEDFWRSLLAGKYKSGRLRRVHKEGKEKWIQATYNPILDIDNNVTRVIKIAQDITQEKEAEIEMKRAKDMAEALNIQKDHFIANVSHEIRTPIHAVLGFTELLLEQEKDSLKQDYLKSVKTAGDNLLFIINDILDLSKLEAGMIQIDNEPFRLDEVVRDAFAILHLKAHQKKIIFRHFLSEDVPVKLIGDRNRLMQVLINLLGNAIKFTAQGSVKLFVDLLKKNDQEVLLQFNVEDSGIGIPQEKMEIIFHRFSQAEEDTSRQYGGTGLGLNISRQLIEKQNGSIEVKSEEGKGSSFIVTLPFVINPNIPGAHSENCTKDPKKIKKGRILLCEDNELNQRLIKAILSEVGLEVDLAENGNKGLEFFRKNQYDLIFMDIQMPEKDGYATVKDIRKKLDSKIPIVALTANFLFSEREKCLSLGMNDYLSKPFSKEELLRKVAFWLSSEKKEKSIEEREQGEPKQEVNLSFEMLEEMSGGNPLFEKEMIELFLKQSHEILQDMETAMEIEDLECIRLNSHKLKTSFGIIGADTNTLQSLETAAETNELNEIIQKDFKSLKTQLQQIFIILKHKIN